MCYALFYVILMHDIPLCLINNHGRVKTWLNAAVIYCVTSCCLHHATCLGPNSHFQALYVKPDMALLG
jgi:hypothetical protein